MNTVSAVRVAVKQQQQPSKPSSKLPRQGFSVIERYGSDIGKAKV